MDAEPSKDEQREQAETLADIREGLASIARGEGMPLEHVIREMRAKFGISEEGSNSGTATPSGAPRSPSVR